MKNNIYTIYSEYTPNPKVMKFVCNQIISSEMIEFDNTPTQNNFPLIYELFLLPFVESIFLGKNFISIEKNDKIEWDDISFETRVMIQEKLNSGILASNKKNVNKENKSNVKINRKKTKKELLIEEIFEKNIRPYVMQDGGDISLISYDNGIVKVLLQGACNGCPSSTYTLKQGIEKRLRDIIGEEIKEVIPIN
tara:strand:- start:273 stop:854 length:582 start_codon:yes stop_codon:yes gene_type:complete